MNVVLKTSLLVVLYISFGSCDSKTETTKSTEEKRKTVEMVTNYGTMTIALYNETPLHRDNFINLATHGAFDSILFHRVIKEFMIQGGDPDSKKAKPSDTLGEGDIPYMVKAEFNKNLFHKKGVLAAARDGNPEKSSSGMQFYITQGKIYNDSLLERAENRINQGKAKEYYKNTPEIKPLLDSIQNAMKTRNMKRYTILMDSIGIVAKNDTSFTPYVFPKEHREVYKSIGGTPHLDQNYTVFGEVVKGMEVIDSIANVQTNLQDRPISDVRILTVKVIEKSEKAE